MPRLPAISLKRLQSWRLFWILALVISITLSSALPHADLHSARDTERLILRSVRCAIPFFLVAFTASAFATLWPNRLTRWALSNRRYFGLTFAFGMSWHLTFVAYFLIMFGVHLNRIALMLDLIGLGFLIALTLTSFRRIGRCLSGQTWKYLHRAGVYWIWILLTYIYLGGARDERDPFSLSVLGILGAAWGVRVAAWKRRRINRRSPISSLPRRSAY